MARSFEPYRAHPWHGLDPGPAPPGLVNAWIEITPFDLVKYEVDKPSGYLRVDRPQRTSALPPELYGFVPRTYCGPRVAALMPGTQRGDGDPLDVFVLSERPITRAEVILRARVVGGIPMNDTGEADDKIVAVLDGDEVWGAVREVGELPRPLLERLRHYLATYKTLPGEDPRVVLGPTYGHDHAERVVVAALADYAAEFGERASRPRWNAESVATTASPAPIRCSGPSSRMMQACSSAAAPAPQARRHTSEAQA